MMRIALARGLSFFVVFCVSLSAHAQALLQLGELSYSRAPAPYLRTVVRIQPSFFRAVGGVAFDSVAVGRDGLVVTALHYDADKPDGRRLVVTVGRPGQSSEIVDSQIYDWQLVPIARFALSDEGSAMTLFGRLEDAGFQDELLEGGGRAINYHPALDNTLVGLRLMQADILLFEPNAVDLPKRIGGEYVLGLGEARPDVELNKTRYAAIRELLEEEDEKGNSYSSYVVGDLDATVEFYVDGGKLAFTGQPTWTMWDNPADFRAANDFYELIRELRNGNPLAKLLFEREYQTDAQEVTDFFLLVDKAQEGDQTADLELEKKFASDAPWIRDLGKYVTIMERYEAMNEVPVEVNRQLGERVSSLVAAVEGINPTVYATLKKVMRYRALFRHFLGRDPQAYRRFIASLDDVEVTPNVTTPTVQRRERLH